MITQKSRTIIAVNRKGESLGFKPNVKCSSAGKSNDRNDKQWGPFTDNVKCLPNNESANHRGCLCDVAVDNNKPVYVTYQGNFVKAFAYWIPLSERPHWVLHFGVGNAFEYVEGR